MKYSCEIEIELPRERVVELFDNPDNMQHWQEGFVSLDHLSGEPGAAGAQSTLTYKMGKRDIEMVETILRNELPAHFDATYEASNVYNVQENRFEELPGNRTKWVSDCEFQFKGFMRVFGFLMPGAFKKQSNKFMVDFKNFAENAK